MCCRNDKEIPDFLQCCKTNWMIFVITSSLKSVHQQNDQSEPWTVLDGGLRVIRTSLFYFYWLLSVLSQKGQIPKVWGFPSTGNCLCSLLWVLAAGKWERCALICIRRHFTWGKGKSKVCFCEHFAGVNEARTVFNCSCAHVTYLKLLFPFKDLTSSCH